MHWQQSNLRIREIQSDTHRLLNKRVEAEAEICVNATVNGKDKTNNNKKNNNKKNEEEKQQTKQTNKISTMTVLQEMPQRMSWRDSGLPSTAFET